MNENYLPHVQALATFIQIVSTPNSPRVFWKGNAWYAFQNFDGYKITTFERQLDAEFRVYDIVTARAIHFINVSSALANLPVMSSFWKVQYPGPHIGHAGARFEINGSLLWTSISTQKVINDMCVIS